MIDRIKFHLRTFFDARFYDSDGLYTIHNSGFRNEDSFKIAYEKGADTTSWGLNPKIEWRVHTILWAAKKCIELDGDFVELGVNRGGFCQSILTYLDFNAHNKKFWLFDSFEGQFHYDILNSEETTGIKEKNYNYQNSYDYVKSLFKNDNVEIIKGLVPDSLSSYNGHQVAFLSIDMNSSIPEIAALEFFWEKVVAGGVIVLDDYCYYGHLDQYIAMNDFCRKNKLNILSMPTGQGIIVKNQK